MWTIVGQPKRRSGSHPSFGLSLSRAFWLTNGARPLSAFRGVPITLLLYAQLLGARVQSGRQTGCLAGWRLPIFPTLCHRPCTQSSPIPRAFHMCALPPGLGMESPAFPGPARRPRLAQCAPIVARACAHGNTRSVSQPASQPTADLRARCWGRPGCRLAGARGTVGRLAKLAGRAHNRNTSPCQSRESVI